MKRILLTGATGYIVRQTAIFEPVGLMGLAYWYGIYPLHALMFSGMIKRIAVKAVASKRMETTPTLGNYRQPLT